MVAFTDRSGNVLQLLADLALSRWTHGGIANPYLQAGSGFETNGRGGSRYWQVYTCSVCGGVVLAASRKGSAEAIEIYPSTAEISSEIPDRAREYMKQSRESMGQPIGSIVLSDRKSKRLNSSH